MELTKEQSLQIIFNNNKIEALKHRYKFTTKTKWKCLSCLTPLYISYKQYGTNSIFCDVCYPKFANKPTMAQYQYMRVLKEYQVKLIETQLNDTLKNDFNLD